MEGSATFTIVMSSNNMKVPTQTAPSVHHLRSTGSYSSVLETCPRRALTRATVSDAYLIVNGPNDHVGGPYGTLRTVRGATTPPPKAPAAVPGVVCYLLRRAHQRIALTTSQLLPDGRHPRDIAILRVIADNAPVSQQLLADYLAINRSVMVKLIDVLEAGGE